MYSFNQKGEIFVRENSVNESSFGYSLLAPYSQVGNLRSNNADDNENVKETIALISKTTTSHVHHTLYISFPFLHDCDLKMPHFAFHRGRKQATTKFYFSASELEYGFLKFSSRRVRLHLTK